MDTAKLAVEKAVADMAADMLEIQAVRAKQPGRAFPSDTPWQKAFEHSFQFDPTPDRTSAIEAVRNDLQQIQANGSTPLQVTLAFQKN